MVTFILFNNDDDDDDGGDDVFAVGDADADGCDSVGCDGSDGDAR